MAVLGIVLIVLAVLFGLGVSVSSTASTTMEVFGVDFGVSVPTVFFLGAAAGALLIAGLWLTKKGLGRGYRRRKEMRELRAQAASTETAEVTERETAPEVTTGAAEPTEPVTGPAAESDAEPGAEPGADEHLATGRHVATDPTDTKQPR